MKIAVVTDDGKSISQHFGRAAYYMVVTVENGVISGHEMREKIGHAQFHQQEENNHDEKQNESHGFGAEADHRHGRMAETIMDCEAVLCGGMGKGAYENMKARNIRPVVTDMIEIDEAVRSYAEGRIVDHVDKLH